MKAAIYCRVARRGHPRGESPGIACQRELCQVLADQKHWQVTAMHIDDGAAATATNRPGYADLCDDIAAGRIDAVVVTAVDRLHRSTHDLHRFIELADAHGIALASVTDDMTEVREGSRLIAGLTLPGSVSEGAD